MRGWRKNIAEQYGEDALRELDRQQAMAGASGASPCSPGAAMQSAAAQTAAAAPRGQVSLPGLAPGAPPGLPGAPPGAAVGAPPGAAPGAPPGAAAPAAPPPIPMPPM